MNWKIKIWDIEYSRYVKDEDGQLALFDTVEEAKQWLNNPDELNKDYLETNFEYHDHFKMDETGYDLK